MLSSVFRLLPFSPSVGRVFSRFAASSMVSTIAPTPWTPNRYPKARRSDHVDTYASASRGKVPVPDPYNYLENDTEETDRWTTEQEAFTRQYLDKNTDLERLRTVFRDCNNYAKVFRRLRISEVFAGSNFLDFSSLHLSSTTMVGGTGSTTVALSRKRVSLINFRKCPVFIFVDTAFYRSKDNTLPDFSSSQGIGGDIFFDVGFIHSSMRAPS